MSSQEHDGPGVVECSLHDVTGDQNQCFRRAPILRSRLDQTIPEVVFSIDSSVADTPSEE
jgi:hypothetical protein